MLTGLLLLLVGTPTIADVMRVATDPCRSQGDEIVVCKHAPGAPDRYRLPQIDQGWDPGGVTRSVSGERHDLIDGGGAGDLTAGSCSAVGASGFTGCQIRTWQRNDQQKGW